jgi:uncharacterized protein YaiL (DUF2058 family)
MLDLKAKLLAAGVVTADQVKKVEDEQAERRARDKERREAEQRRREVGGAAGGDRPRGERPRGGPHSDRPHGERRSGREGPSERPRRERPAGARDGNGAETPPEATAAETPTRPSRARDTRSFKERRADENLEKRARREHEWTQALRWRERLADLQRAGKSEQYAAVRGWVMKERLDNTQITEAAQRFFFTTYAGTLSHLTVEPDIHDKLVNGSAGIVAFIGYNGQEHAVVAADMANDVRTIKPEWLRHLIGVTDIEPPLVKPPAAEQTPAGPESDVDDASATADPSGLSLDEEGESPSDPHRVEGVAVDSGGDADDGSVAPSAAGSSESSSDM